MGTAKLSQKAAHPQPCDSTFLLSDKLLDQDGFADARLSADEHCASLTGCGLL
jgi:hypothetical protein